MKLLSDYRASKNDVSGYSFIIVLLLKRGIYLGR